MGEKEKKFSRKRKACTFIVFFKHVINLTERNHSSEKKKHKKYLDPGEGEKIREKNKSLYLYCVLETVHPSPRKHAFIREKKTQKIFTYGRRRKDTQEEQKLLPLLCSSTR